MDEKDKNPKIQKKYILSAIIFILLLGVYFFFSPYKFSFFPSCPFYKYGGLHCAGCGSQRALHHLLHLEFQQMFRSNLLFPLWIYLAGDYLYKNMVSKAEPLLLNTKIPYGIFFIILIYTILRNIPYEPFIYLAPTL